MKKWMLGALALSVALLAGLTGESDLFAQEKNEKGDKVPTIKEIMKKTTAGKKSFQGTLKGELKATPVKWDEVQKKTKEYQELAEKLGKNKPPKGSDKSWEKLSKEFADNAKALHEAADKKDAKAAGEALDKLGKSCKPCHDEHQDK